MRQKGKRGGGVIILTKTSMYFFFHYWEFIHRFGHMKAIDFFMQLLELLN